VTNATQDPIAALAIADDALIGALRAGEAERALGWARVRNGLLERIAHAAAAGFASARERLAEARRANDALLALATSERDRVGAELAEARAVRRTRESARGVAPEAPRFVSRRA
jgi:hypothetical protein